MEAAFRAELRIDSLHQLSTQKIVAAVALVEERGVIEERLHQEQLLPEQPAEILHSIEHPTEEAESRAHLARREPGHHGPALLSEIPAHGAEERVLAIVVPVDAESQRVRVRDLNEGQLRHSEGTDLDVDQHDRIAVVARRPKLDARPALLGRREDAKEAVARPVEAGPRIDPEARADLRRDEAPVESLAEWRWQPVKLLEGAELPGGDARVPQPADPLRAVSGGRRSQRARARARSSGVFRFMKATSGSAKRSMSSTGTRTTRTSSKMPVILSRPACKRCSMTGRHVLR